jgi:hypothetical protein
LLRFIDRYVSFYFVREKLRGSYSAGRPSIDQEVRLRILLLGYLYGVTSERKLLEELPMHLAWRWFTNELDLWHRFGPRRFFKEITRRRGTVILGRLSNTHSRQYSPINKNVEEL